MNHISVNDIPISDRQDLCQIIIQNDWEELARHMGYKENDIQAFKMVSKQTYVCPIEELLTSWGEQNHTVTELFVLLSRTRQYSAMTCVQHLVDSQYHKLVLKESIIDSQEKKILNIDLVMLSNENNESTHQQTKFINGDVNEFASTIPKIDYKELCDATKNWNEAYILGKGGFGTVFKGVWKFTDVAIKRIEYRGTRPTEMNKIQIKQSLNELRYLNSCRHDNILPLYGYCMNGDNPCLIFQLMSGTLEQRLFGSTRKPALFVQERIKIAIGTARGLQYLHTFNIKPLIHGDIKPANILLDKYDHPKIGDFGLAREGNIQDAAMDVSRVYGTRPYLPYEFLMNKTLSTKVDTYSFGVVLMELATGLKAYDKKKKLLPDYIRANLSTFNDYIDIPIDNDTCMYDCKWLLYLGLACAERDQEKRPEMVTVLNKMETKLSLNQTPRPIFQGTLIVF